MSGPSALPTADERTANEETMWLTRTTKQQRQALHQEPAPKVPDHAPLVAHRQHRRRQAARALQRPAVGRRPDLGPGPRLRQVEGDGRRRERRLCPARHQEEGQRRRQQQQEEGQQGQGIGCQVGPIEARRVIRILSFSEPRRSDSHSGVRENHHWCRTESLE